MLSFPPPEKVEDLVDQNDVKKKKKIQLFNRRKQGLECISIMYFNQMLTRVFSSLKSNDACPRETL